MKPYEIHAQALIASLCDTRWKAATTAPNGYRYKHHRPLCVPARAQALVEQLGRHDTEAVTVLLTTTALPQP